jgi:hypothetical protein
MAGMVKGELDGRPIMLENAATEATLEALLQATLANSSNKSQAAKIQKAYEDALKTTTKSQNDNLASMKKQIKEKESLTQKIKEEKEAREKLMSGLNDLGALIGKGINVAFATATPKVSDFTNALSGIPIIGPIIGALGNAMQGQIDKFRELSQVGADFGGGIDRVRSVAAQAGLSLDTFTSAVTANSKDLALLGGNASAGARIFVAVNKSLQGPFQQSLARLGFSMEETAEYTAGYIAQQTRLGLAQRMTQGELNKGAQNYLLELDRLARVTGMSRKEAQAELDRQTNDKRLVAMYAAMNAGASEITKTIIAGVGNVDKEFGDALVDLVANKGVVSATNTMTQSMALMNPELVKLAVAMSNETATLEGATDVLRRHGKLSADRLAVEGKNIALMKNNNVTQYDSIIAGTRFQNFAFKAAEAVDKQAESMNNSARNQANLDKRLLELRNQIMSALMPTFQYLTETIASNGEAILKFITAIVQGTEQFIRNVGDKGLGTVIGQALSDVIKSALSSMFTSKEALGGLVFAVGALFGAAEIKRVLAAKLAELFSNNPGSSGPQSTGKFGRYAKAATIMAAAGYAVDAGAGMLGAGNNTIDTNKDDENWKQMSAWEKMQSGTARGIEHAGSFLFLDNLVNQAKSERIANESKYLQGQGRAPAPSQSAAETARLANQKNASTNATASAAVSADLMQAAEVAKVQTSAEVKAIAEALKTLDYGKLTVPEATIKSIDDGTNKLRFLRAEVNAMTASFKTLNNTGLEKITAGLGRLDESFKSFNKSFVEEFMTKFKELDKQSQETLLTNLNDKMDQLNMNTSALVELTAENTKNGKNIVRNTQGASGRVY